MEKKLIDYEGFEAYAKGVREKYAEKTDIPTSLSKLQEDSTHQIVTATDKTKWDKVTDKVDKVDGKQLSSNDYTDEDKQKVGQIPDNPKYTDTIPDLTPYAKKESVPTKISQLENDKTFKTETEIQSMIEKASSLKKEVVTSLPTTGKDDVIYLVKDDKGQDNNNYLEYLWLNGKYELIGSTQVDLSGYMTKEDFESKWENVRRVVNGSWNEIDRIKDKIPKPFQGEYGDPSEDDKSYVTPWYVDNQYLGKQDIQEFTQQELEEAFK